MLDLKDAVNVVPFAARQEWASPTDFEIWWEDPRDLFQVVILFASNAAPDRDAVSVAYWQHSWPKVRLPKGADVGSGREGWLAIDDWTNGRWQEADCEISPHKDTLSITFHPLNREEFPDEQEFPAAYRRTLKLRLRFEQPGLRFEELYAYTDSVWREAGFNLEWKAVDGEQTVWDGYLDTFNGEILALQALTPSTEVEGSAGWRSTVAGAETDGILASVRYAYNEDKNSYDRTIVTVRSEGHSFSFLVDDALAGEPIYIRDLGVLVNQADAGLRLTPFEAEWGKVHGQTLYQRIRERPEQTWERAWADMPPKRRFYFVLGCEGGRQKFGVEPTGEIFLRENFIRRVPGKDTPRLGWEGGELRFKFGFPEVEPGDRSILDGYLPVIRATWLEGDLCFEQEAYATWLKGDMLAQRMAGDDPVIAMIKIQVTNTGTATATVSLPLTAVVNQDAPQRLEVSGELVYASGPDAHRLCYLFESNVSRAVNSTSHGILRTEQDRLTYELSLPAGALQTCYVKIPFINLTEVADVQRLRALSYEAERERVVAFWRRRIAEGAQIETPNATFNNFYRTHLMHMLVINDREPGSDRNVARCGGFHYGSFPDEGCMVISDLDRRGYAQAAENCLELYVHYQGTAQLPGNFKSVEGVFYGSGGYEVAGYNRNQGWVLWCLAEHYRYTRGRAWLERVAPALVKGCDWITRERRATMVSSDDARPPIEYGFLPAGSLEDVTDYWTWLSTNAYAYLGLRAAAEVLAEIEHPQATRLQQDAQAFGQDLRTGFFEACIRSPVVPLRDGTWVPHFPPRQQRRGRDFGWLREVLEGAAHLVYCGIIAPDEPAARWIIEDYEDNLFLSDQYGYPAPDFERQWFSWGGFSMQPNLLIFPLLYLARDEPEHFLRSVFNPFASAFYPDTMMLTEHALPTLGDWLGDHFKSSDEALSTWWLRSMFLAEHGDELFVGQAVPRAWLEDGKALRVERGLTHFGEVSFEMVSHVATGTIVVNLEPPRRNPPRQILLRVRHPEDKAIQSVWVNGLPHREIDKEKEVIYLNRFAQPLEVRVKY